MNEAASCSTTTGQERKRTRSTTTSTTSASDAATSEDSLSMKPPQMPAKKSKSSSTVAEIRSQLGEAKAYIEKNQSQLPLNFDQFVKFLCVSHGKSDSTSIALDHTDDIPALVRMLTEVCDFAENNLRSRMKRIRARLDKQDPKWSKSDTSDMSDISSICGDSESEP
ncbi:hypothetical protein QAD02_013712 [Eretmocerus hayati]|uniref:Uncharacterized protein n=1 Tax=Eretmocerus hayati TaxID=131215 RepID=A0ACC2P815_9HYME|nr:hypothetical protein QAD02_013712 [Eretmocerus hayati]